MIDIFSNNKSKRRRNRLKRRQQTKKRGKRNKNKSYKKENKGKRKTTIKYKDTCSPVKNKNELMNFTCYTKDALKKLKALWNTRHPDSKIKSNNSKIIWDQLRKKMSSVCERESCWLKQKWMDQGMVDKLESNFATEQPESWKKNKNEWLNSLDITNVMRQFEKKYKEFEFIGPSPIDFDDHEMYGECVWEELCKFQLSEKIKNKKTKIGIIFNLDKHDKPGSHWVCMVVDIKKKKIFYFDSYGDSTPGRIKKLAKRIINQGKILGKKYKFIENKKRHQYSNSECGMFCLYVIIKLIEGKTIKQLSNKKIQDKTMMRLRNIYFNKI